MSTTAIPRFPSPLSGITRQIGAAFVQILTFTGDSLAGRYAVPPPDDDPPDATEDVLDEETMIAIALLCAAHF